MRAKTTPGKPRPRKDRGPLAAEPPPVPGPRRLLAWTLSGAAHVAVVASLFWLAGRAPQEPAAIPITLVQLPEPEEPPGPPGPSGSGGAPIPIEISVPESMPTPALTRPTFRILAAAQPAAEDDTDAVPVDTMSDVMSDAQLAGAAHVGEGPGNGYGGAGRGAGGGGGGCDVGQMVQQALRRDRLVQGAVAGANRLGKSVLVWNGDWVRAGAQDGKGLSAVREAIMWEVGFAPEACRKQRMHGVLLLSLADGRTRFAIGAAEWRWSDLLGIHEARR